MSHSSEIIQLQQLKNTLGIMINCVKTRNTSFKQNICDAVVFSITKEQLHTPIVAASELIQRSSIKCYP